MLFYPDLSKKNKHFEILNDYDLLKNGNDNLNRMIENYSINKEIKSINYKLETLKMPF